MTTLDLSIAMQIMAQVSQVAAFPLEAASRSNTKLQLRLVVFCCCRKANRGAHDMVDFCEYRVIEPVGICCFTVVGGVVIGVCLVCAGACKCVACTASYINEKALKPVERGVGGGIVCVGEALSYLGEPNEETKAAWKAAELEKDAKPEEQGYCSWFWSGVFNCLCVPKANDHQEPWSASQAWKRPSRKIKMHFRSLWSALESSKTS